MTPKEYANELVNEFRNILQEEDTECGNEILCTLIAKRCAKVVLNQLEKMPLIYIQRQEVLTEIDNILSHTKPNIMKWSELPKEYQDLEKKFKSYCDVAKNEDNIEDRFTWVLTPQKTQFWDKCYFAKTIADLPQISITDYPDTKEPEKKERYFIVFWRKGNLDIGINQVTTNGSYFNLANFHEQFPDRMPTDIRELSESDYNDFIA